MKIRSGFVSNSSSSSFVIYGVWIDEDDVKKLLSDDDLKVIEEEPYMLGEVADNLPMFYHYNDDTEEVAFGRSYSSIKDDETGREFKRSIEKKLKEIFGKEIKCDLIHHTYYC
jgi:hypothetical protein